MNTPTQKLLSALVLAALAPCVLADDAVSDNSRADEVVIVGKRETHQVTNASREDLQDAAPGTSPLKVLEKLPGVEFQGADSFGNYEWAERITIRGFAQDYLGFTLDGIPLGDMEYGNDNGLHISRAISQENIRRVAVAEGAGSLATASTSNLGGAIQFFSDNPDRVMTVQGEAGFGSENAHRVFGRFDTGVMASGATAYFSATDQKSDKWKGVGPQEQTMFNAKLVQPVQNGTISLYADHQERKEIDYQDMSAYMIKVLGWNWDNYGNLVDAVNATKGLYTNPNVALLNNPNSGSDPIDAAYGGSSGLRKDDLFDLAFDLNPNDNLHLKNSVYYHHDAGQGHYVTPVATPGLNGLPVAARTTDYTIGRVGIISSASWTFGDHTIEGGVWLERNDHNVSRHLHALYNENGNNEDLDWLGSSDVFGTYFDDKFVTTTKQFYIADTVKLMNDAATLNYGFKSSDVNISATALHPDPNYDKGLASGELEANKNFLPQVGFNYELGKGSEVFASVAENMRAFEAGVNGPFYTKQSSFDQIKDSIKPETSTTFDLGYRFRQDGMLGLVDIYHTDFRDRLLAINPCPFIQSCANALVNVGKVTANGIEAALDLPLVRSLTWSNTLSYDVSQYQSNYTNGVGGAVVDVSGKDVVDAPRVMFTTILGFDDGSWFAHLSEKYTDKRYYTYTNDQSVPSYWLGNLDAGFKQPRWNGLRDVRITLDVTNLWDKKYVSTVGSTGYTASGDNQTLQVGAPRAVFLSFSGKY